MTTESTIKLLRELKTISTYTVIGDIRKQRMSDIVEELRKRKSNNTF